MQKWRQIQILRKFWNTFTIEDQWLDMIELINLIEEYVYFCQKERSRSFLRVRFNKWARERGRAGIEEEREQRW